MNSADLPEFDPAQFLTDEDAIAAYLAEVAGENDPGALAEAQATVARARRVHGLGFKNGMRPVHPGEVLLEDYIKPSGVSLGALAEALALPVDALQELVDGRQPMTAEVAEKLASHFGGEPSGWLALQASYEDRAGT
jgi:addiction module HigA family antidote